MKRVHVFSLCLFLLLAAVSATAQRSLTLFQWQDPVWSTPRVFPTGINNYRTVVGYIGDQIEKKAFIYRHGQMRLVEFKHPNLGGNQFFDINDDGYIVGWYYNQTSTGAFEQASFLRRPDGTFLVFQNSPWGFFLPQRINNVRQVLGRCGDSTFIYCLRRPDGIYHALTPPSNDATFTDISDLPQTLVGTDNTFSPPAAFTYYRNGALIDWFNCTDQNGVPAETHGIAMDAKGNVLVSCHVNGKVTYFLRVVGVGMRKMQRMELPPVSPAGVPYPILTDINDTRDVTGSIWGFDVRNDSIEPLRVRGLLFTNAFSVK